MAKPLGRNDWCPCGSGMKVKKCCGDKAIRRNKQSKFLSGWSMAAFASVAVILMGWIWYANHQPDPRLNMPDISQAAAPEAPLAVTNYTEIPEVDLTVLTDDQRKTVLDRVNVEKCPCGCGFTLAACRHLDQSCGTSLPIARKIVADIVSGT